MSAHRDEYLSGNDASQSSSHDTFRRNRFAFHIAIGAFVLLSSFLYGLVSGLSKGASPLQAALSLDIWSEVEEELPGKISLPHGVKGISVGRDVEVNGRAVEMIAILSDRGVEEIVSEEHEKWAEVGFKSVKKASAERGVAVAVDPQSGASRSLVLWKVPTEFRGADSEGYRTQGMLTIRQSGERHVIEREEQGEVPDVPLRSGGEAGALVSSDDQGDRSYTGSYTNPGTVKDNYEFYRQAMADRGWKLLGGDGGDESSASAFLNFERETEELTLLINPIAGPAAADAKTLVSIVRSPRAPDFSSKGAIAQ